MASRHPIAPVEDFPADGSRVIADLEGQEIAVFRIDGEYWAVANYCVHQGGPLCEGRLGGQMAGGDDGWEWRYDAEAQLIHCPWHNWRFDVTTGRNVDDDRYAAITYDVEVADGTVYVCRE